MTKMKNLFQKLSMIILVVFISAILAQAVGAASSITFTRTSGTDFVHIDSPNAMYDYAPTAFAYWGGTGSYWNIWNCTQVATEKGSADAIRYSQMHKSYNANLHKWHGVVLNPSTDFYAWDARNACAPSVVKHTNSGLVQAIRNATGNQALTKVFLMYYECAPQFSDQNGWIGGVSSICLAASGDGITWYKYSDVDGDNYGEWKQNDPTQDYVTPVVKSSILESGGACGYEFNNNFSTKHRLNTPQASGCGYGAGHPSAIRLPDGRLRLFYYDDGAYVHPNGTSYYYVDSWDGIHFGSPQAFDIPNISGPGPGLEVQYDRYNSVFIALTMTGHNNLFSFISATSAHNVDPNSSWSALQPIGQSTSANYGAFAQPTILSNEYGWVNLSQNVVMFSGEYQIGTNPWYTDAKIYRISGRFTVTP